MNAPFASQSIATADVTAVTTVPRVRTPTHLPSLDGLRAISIAFVLLGHLSGTAHFGTVQLGMGDIAHLGVVVFFVISGFLITTLLMAEESDQGGISLKLFYLRRALRILPASYAFLAVIVVLRFIGIIEVPGRDLLFSFTYTVNFHAHRVWEVGHLWSLSVEEQFYLLWPFAFVALGGKRAIWVAASVMVVGPAARLGAWAFLHGTPYADLEMFPMVADSLAAGCLLAGLRNWLEARRWYLELFRPMYSLLVLSVILMINRLMGFTVAAVLGASLINVGIAVLVHRSVYRASDRIGRALNFRPVAFVGTLSYSLYLWQQLFLNRHSNAWVNAFPQNLVFVIVVALASYLLLERPLLRIRRRLTAVRHESADSTARVSVPPAFARQVGVPYETNRIYTGSNAYDESLGGTRRLDPC